MFRSFVVSLILVATCAAQTLHPANSHQVLVSDVRVSGVRSIGTTELDQIVSVITARAINDDEEEISDRLRFSFQDHGFFAAKINSVRVRASDALSNPKPVTVDVEIDEGPRFKFGEIKFQGNRAITSKALKEGFPIHKGEIFNRSKVAAGLDTIRALYSKHGYIESISIPNTSVGTEQLDLNIDIDEGRQFRMGSIDFGSESNLAQRLRSNWKLESGKPFDVSYPQRFVEDQRSLLPATFDQESQMIFVRDCKKAVINILVQLDPQHPAQPPAEVPCEASKRN